MSNFQDEVEQQRLTRGQVWADRAWWVDFMTPRPLGLAFVVVVACAMVPWLGFAAFSLSIPGGDEPTKALSAIAYFCMAPTAAPFVAASIALAGADGARALLSGMWLTLAASGTATLLLAALILGPVATVGTVLVFGGGLLALLGMTTMSFLSVARIRGKGDLRRRRAARVVALLEHFGSLDEAVILEHVGGGTAAVREVLSGLETHTGMERAHGRVWLAARVRGRKAALLAQLESGERRLSQLATAVREPEVVLRSWIDDLGQLGIYDLRIVGEEVVLTVAGAIPACAGCGAGMGLVGRGLWRCLHCGNEQAGEVG